MSVGTKILQEITDEEKQSIENDIKQGRANIENAAEPFKKILEQFCTDIQIFPNYWADDPEHQSFDINAHIKDNDRMQIYGRVDLENNKIVSADLQCSSGPSILTYDFVKCVNALYEFIESGGNHYTI